MGNLLYLIKAYMAENKKDYEKAIVMFENVIAAGDRNPGIYSSLAFCHKELNDLDSALKYCKDALDIDPHHYAALKLISLIHEAMHNYDEAYTSVKRAFANQNKILSETPERVIKFARLLSKIIKRKELEQEAIIDWPVEDEIRWLNWADEFIKQYELGSYNKNNRSS